MQEVHTTGCKTYTQQDARSTHNSIQEIQQDAGSTTGCMKYTQQDARSTYNRTQEVHTTGRKKYTEQDARSTDVQMLVST
jgi:hypothetical protein